MKFVVSKILPRITDVVGSGKFFRRCFLGPGAKTPSTMLHLEMAHVLAYGLQAL